MSYRSHLKISTGNHKFHTCSTISLVADNAKPNCRIFLCRIIESKGVILRHPNEDGFRENFVSTQDSLSFCCQLHHCDPDSVLASLPLSVMNEAVWHPSDSPPTDKIQLLTKLSNEIFFLQLALLIIGWIEAVCLLNRRNLRAHVLG